MLSYWSDSSFTFDLEKLFLRINWKEIMMNTIKNKKGGHGNIAYNNRNLDKNLNDWH